MPRLQVARVITSVALVLLCGAARSAGQAGSGRPVYGTTDPIFHAVNYGEFTPTSSSTPYQDLFSRYSTVPNGLFVAAPHLPAGAQIVSLRLDYCDESATENVLAFFYECPSNSAACAQYGGLSSGDGSTGCNTVAADITDQNQFVDNATKRYAVQVMTQSGTLENRFFGVTFGVKLRVSPAPAAATFLDVPTSHGFFQFVEALYASGITAGCGGGNYCVNSPITRGEMAVFLAAALGLHFPN
jgi:hypothetical protein